MVELHVHGLDIAIRKLKSIGEGAPKFMAQQVSDAMHLDLWPMWLKHITLSDHTLTDLAHLGHPYSTQFGVDTFMHKDEDVHIQDGGLVNASRIEMTNTSTGVEGRLMNDAPEYVLLRYGTWKMRMRDPGGAALRDALPLIRTRLEENVKGAIINIVARG